MNRTTAVKRIHTGWSFRRWPVGRRLLPVVLAAAALALAGCSVTEPLAAVPARDYTAFPLPSGAATVSPATTTAPPVENCDATASLRPRSVTEPGGTPRGPVLARILARDRLIVGVDQSTNLFSFRDPVTGALEGFDVDIAREVARDLLGDPNKIEFILLSSAERIQALQDSAVDIVVKAMTITCARAQEIAFSTVYFEASQRLLVSKDSDISGPTDLAGERVCSVGDTTSLATVQRQAPQAIIIAMRNWDDCLVVLQQGQVDVASTDDSILAGMAVQDPNLHIVGEAMEEEPYGIGVDKNNDDLVRAVNGTLERIRRDGTWTNLYDKWLTVLGSSDGPPAPKYRD